MNNLNEMAETELKSVLSKLKNDIDKGDITSTGIRVSIELTKLGWESLSDVQNKKHSDFSYKCGYSGVLQQLKLVKIFEKERNK